LNDSGTYFEASGPLGDYPLALRSGSMVEVKGVCQVLLNRATVPFAVRGFTLLFDSPHSVTVLRPGPWWDSTRISWALWGIGLFAFVAALWATLLRRQVHAKTRELQSSLAAKRKAREFDQARNEVLEGIAGNSPLPESMERLALAIEGQIPECVCALVMPPDGRSFLNGRPSPVLIAPGLGEDSQHELLGPLSRMLDGSAGLDQVTTSGNCDSSTPLLEPLQAAGLNFSQTSTTIVFSASGSAAGLIILLLKPSAPDPGEPAPQAILQSSARLLALARDHSRMHEQLVHEARHDGLTGLPNRMVAEDRLEQAIARAVRARKVFAVICIDLDGFKAVNDEFGHDAGDELLRTASARLRSRVRHADTLARMGGDEFLAIVEDCAGDSGAQSVAQSLIAVLQEPIVLEGRSVQISGSIGVAMYPRDGKNASQLKRCADQAMYQAKGRGGSQVSFFSGNAHGLAQASEATSAGNR
jgi:diguanylate cyclase (GGDEF)-like protein